VHLGRRSPGRVHVHVIFGSRHRRRCQCPGVDRWSTFLMGGGRVQGHERGQVDGAGVISRDHPAGVVVVVVTGVVVVVLGGVKIVVVVVVVVAAS
jgi:hypothetical protein